MCTVVLLSEFAYRLDVFFQTPKFVEPDGWDFALSPEGKAHLLRRGSRIFRETFNGLIGGWNDVLHRVYLMVFPQFGLVDHVIALERERDRPGAVIVTHHPVDMETSGRGYIEIPARQLDALNRTGVGFYVLHAPLDCHSELSTSGALAEGLGLEQVRRFAPYVGGDCGVIGLQRSEPFDAFAERVRTLCELPWFRPDQVRFSGRGVSKIAIVAGGGDDADYISEAEALGCDTYLAGHWWTPHAGEWCDQNRRMLREAISRSGMNFLSASHDGSELVVFRDRLEPLFRSWGLDVMLLKQQDHWR